MKFSGCIFYLSLLSTIFAAALLPLAAQEPSTRPRFTTAELKAFLNKASERSDEYNKTFKDLTAEETRTTEIFDKDGLLEKRRTIVSDLIIYQPASHTENGSVTEYRHVREVDGKIVKGRDRRAVRFFERLAKARSVEEELERIKKESQRYDEDILLYNAPLWQGFLFHITDTSAFEYEEIETDRIGGREAVVVRFRQVAEDAKIKIDIDAPKALKLSQPRWTGTIWLDRETAEVLKFSKEVTARSPFFAGPLTVMTMESLFVPSDLGIMVPETIVFASFNPQTNRREIAKLEPGRQLEPEVREARRQTIRYRSFARFDVNTRFDGVK